MISPNRFRLPLASAALALLSLAPARNLYAQPSAPACQPPCTGGQICVQGACVLPTPRPPLPPPPDRLPGYPYRPPGSTTPPTPSQPPSAQSPGAVPPAPAAPGAPTPAAPRPSPTPPPASSSYPPPGPGGAYPPANPAGNSPSSPSGYAPAGPGGYPTAPQAYPPPGQPGYGQQPGGYPPPAAGGYGAPTGTYPPPYPTAGYQSGRGGYPPGPPQAQASVEPQRAPKTFLVSGFVGSQVWTRKSERDALGPGLRLGGLFGFRAKDFLSFNGELLIEVPSAKKKGAFSASAAAVVFAFSPFFHLPTGSFELLVGPKVGFGGLALNHKQGNTELGTTTLHQLVYGANFGGFAAVGTTLSIGAMFSFEFRKDWQVCAKAAGLAETCSKNGLDSARPVFGGGLGVLF